MHAAITFESFVKALSWTFLHSLWVGLIAAFFAGITILATKKKPVSLRYNILTTILFFFIGFTVLLSVNEFALAFSAENSGENIVVSQSGQKIREAVTATSEGFSFFSNAINFFNENSTYLLIMWFIIFVFKLMRLIYGIVGLQRLRNEKLVPAPADWMQRIEILKNQLNIRKQVRLFESYLVKIPVTLGYLRPVILFPVGALTSLPPAQLDAVLLHELAHIRRNDYLINLVQLVMESIFFFNPFVLWISSRIRKERENCCDDMAISKLDSRKDFLTALLSFQDIAFKEVRVAQSFMSSKTLLVERARRIVNDNNSTLNKIERKSLLLAIGLLMLLLLCSRFNNPETDHVGLIQRFQIFSESDGNNWIGKTPDIKVEKDKSTLPSVGLKENKSSNGSAQQLKTLDKVPPPLISKDTEIVIAPVITINTVIKKDNSVIPYDSTPKTYSKSAFSRSQPFIASVIEDLKKEKLIKDEGEKFTFVLSNEKLMVNGIAQPENIHMKILGKYVPNTALEHINIHYACCR